MSVTSGVQKRKNSTEKLIQSSIPPFSLIRIVIPQRKETNNGINPNISPDNKLYKSSEMDQITAII